MSLNCPYKCLNCTDCDFVLFFDLPDKPIYDQTTLTDLNPETKVRMIYYKPEEVRNEGE